MAQGPGTRQVHQVRERRAVHPYGCPDFGTARLGSASKWISPASRSTGSLS
ncbi:hypothetical protein [Streptomyces sp. NPDC059906]|uniref:hypothetical protein n=1 Tax=Streptomyces sp. NPDC059906 TaxID=3346997 RepID=UPI003661D01D